MATRTGTQWPSVDIKEYQDKYVLHADVPGYDEKDIKVEFADGQLVIQASRAEEKEENGTDFTILVSERTQSMFRRSFAVGDGIDPEKIEASYKNGTLTLTLPKSEKVLPRVIPISLKHK